MITPRGVQRGIESTLTFSGARLEDTVEILFYEPGIKVLELKAEARRVIAKVLVAKAAEPGVRAMACGLL